MIQAIIEAAIREAAERIFAGPVKDPIVFDAALRILFPEILH